MNLKTIWMMVISCLVLCAASLFADPSTAPGDTSGLIMRVYKLPKVPRIFRTPLPGQQPDFVSIVKDVDITSGKQLNGIDSNFQTEFTGLLKIVDVGDYEFSMEADFAAELVLDGKEVVTDQWTPDRPGATTKTVSLTSGEHPLKVRFIQDDGGLRCALKWKPPGADSFTSIPVSHLHFEAQDWNQVSKPATQPINDPKYAHRAVFSTRGFASLTDEESDLLVELLEGPTTLSDSARRDLANLLPACNYDKLPYWHQAKVLTGFVRCWYAGQTNRKFTGERVKFEVGEAVEIDDYKGWNNAPRGKYFKTTATFADQTITIFTPEKDSPERIDAPGAIATLPVSLRKLLKNVRVEPHANTNEFNGGGNEIWIRVSKSPSRETLESVFCHEIGHLLMHKTGSHDRWQAESAKDILSTSEYGRRNPSEDLADFCRLYLSANGDSKQIESIRKLFPHRTPLFEELLKKID